LRDLADYDVDGGSSAALLLSGCADDGLRRERCYCRPIDEGNGPN